MPDIKLSLACADYDRTRALWDGRVSPEGIDLTYLSMVTEEIFWRMLQYNDFDIAEMSLSNYITGLSREDDRFTAIPVFPKRLFRHSFIFINKKSGIRVPGDLKAKKVGIPEYSVTAAVWIRGLLQHDYSVTPLDVEWHVGGLEEAGRQERLVVKVPDDVDIHPIPEGKTLNEMLAGGEIDALIAPRAPTCFLQDHPDVDRLFPDYREAEMAYYKRTKIFPIMHTVVIRREIYDAHPWVAQSLYKAFSQAKNLCYETLNFPSFFAYILPWTIAEHEATVSLMGEDFWPYGVEANKTTLEAMTQYSYEQGLSVRKVSVEELFAPNTLKQFKV